jgi:hypothetical protein
LLANSVGLVYPSEDFAIEFVARMEAEGMDVVAGRDILDLRETRIFQTPGQNDVTDNSISPQAHCREAHSHLERNARFFRHDAHGSATPDQFCELSEQRDRVRSFSGEVLAQSVAGAEMRLVAVRKEPSAFRAFPQWFDNHT